jgi:hypothetical protein
MKMKKCGVFVLVCGLLAPYTIWGGEKANDNKMNSRSELSSSLSDGVCKMPTNKSAFFSRKVSSTVRSFGAWRVHPQTVISSSFLSYTSQMSKNKIIRLVAFFVTCDSLYI